MLALGVALAAPATVLLATRPGAVAAIPLALPVLIIVGLLLELRRVGGFIAAPRTAARVRWAAEQAFFASGNTSQLA